LLNNNLVKMDLMLLFKLLKLTPNNKNNKDKVKEDKDKVLQDNVVIILVLLISLFKDNLLVKLNKVKLTYSLTV